MTLPLRAREHAEQRITRSYETAPLQSRWSATPEVEIASIPVAAMMVAAIADKYFKKRYALHEAKTMYKYLSQEDS